MRMRMYLGFPLAAACTLRPLHAAHLSFRTWLWGKGGSGDGSLPDVAQPDSRAGPKKQNRDAAASWTWPVCSSLVDNHTTELSLSVCTATKQFGSAQSVPPNFGPQSQLACVSDASAAVGGWNADRSPGTPSVLSKVCFSSPAKTTKHFDPSSFFTRSTNTHKHRGCLELSVNCHTIVFDWAQSFFFFKASHATKTPMLFSVRDPL